MEADAALRAGIALAVLSVVLAWETLAPARRRG
jgi:hypothetical protein